MILIGISGKRGTGKTLLASFLKQQYGFVDMPFAEELKTGVRCDFGLTKAHTDGALKELPLPNGFTPREIMIRYGQFFRQFDKNWWVNKVFHRINSIPCFISNNAIVRVTISDVRFKNEADYIKQQGGLLVRLNRPQELNIYKTQSNDLSETELDGYKDFDIELPEENNKTPEDLKEFANVIMKYIEVRA